MRVLLVGFPASIHTVKHVAMLAGEGWDLHVVPSTEHPWAAGFRGATLHHLSRIVPPPDGAEAAGCTLVDHRDSLGGGTSTLRERAGATARLIADLSPDLVHSHELQHGAYQVLEARRASPEGNQPPWVVSNWGSDIFWYAREPSDRRAVREVLAHCQAYWCECHRDVGLAWAEGFTGRVLPVSPIAGGYDVARIRGLRRPGPTSARTAVAVKGYQHAVGRAHTALEALRRCRQLLEGRELCLHSATEDTEARFRRLADAAGARLTVLRQAPYDDILRMHGRARVSIGISLSDGISTSFLEALLGGAFPVQSDTACAADWVVDGLGALLVGPDDVEGVEAAVRRALTDDDLVDRATAANDVTIARHLDEAVVRSTVVDAYERLVAEAQADSPAFAGGPR